MKKYDVIIVGAGPAGLSCAWYLSQRGKRCILLEKKQNLAGKVCGDGLSSHAVRVLEKLNIDTNEILELGGKRIAYNVTSHFGEIYNKRFLRNGYCADYSIGVSRDVFDSYLKKKALKAGSELRTDYEVKDVLFENGEYVVGDYSAPIIVYANGIGTRPFSGILNYKEMPVGISSRIIGDAEGIEDNTFYFKYCHAYGKGYGWIFPVGKRTWNIGVWTSDEKNLLKKNYCEFEKSVIEKFFNGKACYDRPPKGAIIGASTKENAPIGRRGNEYHIGDCALEADYMTGEGISFAIESGVETAQIILNEKTESRKKQSIYLETI